MIYLITMQLKRFLLILILPVLLIICLTGCSQNIINTGQNLTLSKHYPRWLSNKNFRTEQTSGIVFIKADSLDRKCFLLVDDIGKINLLTIGSDTVFNFTEVEFSDTVIKYLKDFPKKDFEEITLDPVDGKVYISVEGNGEDFKKYTRILKLDFKNNDIFSAYLENVEELNIQPHQELLKYTQPNIGFEGMAVDFKYFYLALENVMHNRDFSDSTLIYIIDKNSMQIKKILSTKKYSIHTICGLYATDDRLLWGIDRNQRKIFNLKLNENLEISELDITEFKSTIPGYTNLGYVASIESICMDHEKNIYIVDDPWYNFFVPPDSVLSELNSETINNFKQFVPIIYKYSTN